MLAPLLQEARGAPRHHIGYEGFDLYVRPGAGQLPDELLVDLKGIRRHRIEASWNGCAYLL